jgi:hypothetical protein
MSTHPLRQDHQPAPREDRARVLGRIILRSLKQLTALVAVELERWDAEDKKGS